MLYNNKVKNFIEEIHTKEFFEILKQNYFKIFDINISSAEFRSWQNSLSELSEILKNEHFLESYIILEYKLPSSSRRCDVILAGKDKNGKENSVVIELKQWENIKLSALKDTISINNKPFLHPSSQVKGYCEYLKYYHKAYSKENLNLKGCCYLHNLKDNNSIKLLKDPQYFHTLPKDYPIFTMLDKDNFKNYLINEIGYGDGEKIAQKILKGDYEPSTKLLDILDQVIKSNWEWRLIDEQLIAYNVILSSVDDAIKNNKKFAIIVNGAPGTGKSVLAIQLLSYFATKYLKVTYSIGSKAFKTVLQTITQSIADQILKKIYNSNTKKSIPVKDLFIAPSEIAKIGSQQSNFFDLVLLDEAHRLWDFRRIIYNNMNKQLSNTPMIEEVINSSKVVAFFLDDNQHVRANEIGTVEYIKSECKRLSVETIEVNLNLQFRCSGSEDYINWIDQIMDYNKTGSLNWFKYECYDFKIFDDINELQKELDKRKNEGNKCRWVAGFCWKWSSPNSNGTLVHDITDEKFNGWSAPWIEKTGADLKLSENQYYKWAQLDSYYNQIGSIYSVQGFEFDYIGVIFGRDLIIRNGKWSADLSKNKDFQFTKDLKVNKLDPLEKLRNIYRILLTRGMKGTYVFFLDDETKEYFKKNLSL